jgi:hypothetical protein
VIGADGDAQDICAFVAQAVPRLRELGFRVEVAADFPWHIAEPEPALRRLSCHRIETDSTSF